MFVPAFEDNSETIYTQLFHDEIESIYDDDSAEILRRTFLLSLGFSETQAESTIQKLIDDGKTTGGAQESLRILSKLAFATPGADLSESIEFGVEQDVDEEAAILNAYGLSPSSLASKIDSDAFFNYYANDSKKSLSTERRAKRRLEEGASDFVPDAFARDVDDVSISTSDVPRRESLRYLTPEYAVGAVSFDKGALAGIEGYVRAFWTNNQDETTKILKDLCPQAFFNRAARSDDATLAPHWLDVLIASFNDSTAYRDRFDRTTALSQTPEKSDPFDVFKRSTARLFTPDISDENAEKEFQTLVRLNDEGFHEAGTALYAWYALRRRKTLKGDYLRNAYASPVAAFLTSCSSEGELLIFNEKYKTQIKSTLLWRSAINFTPRYVFSLGCVDA